MEELVHIPINEHSLEGMLNIPKNSKAIVLFAHGSGSSRLSPRNNFVANILQKANIATLLFDLLTEEEDIVYETRFNIKLLGERLLIATKWVMRNAKCKNLSIGYFGASTGTAAALQAVAELGNKIKAVVSRGGRPDLAEDFLDKIKAPALLIVGSLDEPVIEMNRFAYNRINAEKKLVIVPGATHLFEEPGKLEEVAELAKEWFVQHLKK